MTDMVPELTNGEFTKFIKEGVSFIDFFAEWCMPCVMMGPIVEDLSEEFTKKMKFGKVNVDDDSEIANKYEIQSIPTFIIFKDGEVAERVTGAMNQEELADLIKKHI